MRSKRRVRTLSVLLASVGALVAVAACNVVAGLDKFEEVACVPDCAPPTTEPGVDAADAADAGDVGETGPVGDGAPPFVVDTRRLWARWRVSDRAPDAASMAVDEAGAVYDPATGMTWERVATVQPTLAAAEAHCASLSPPMVVPSRVEPMTLLDFRRAPAPLVDPVFVLDGGVDAGDATVADLAATYVAENGYTIDFATGTAKREQPTSPLPIRCVGLEATFGSTP